MKDEIKIKKNYLKRYRRYINRIECLEEKLVEVDSEIEGLKSKQITDMPRGGVPITQDDLIIKKEELKHRINNIVLKSREVRVEIYDCIDMLEDNRFAEVLECYFIECMTFEQIATTKNYSVRHVSYLYSLGLRNIKIPKTLSD